MSDKAVYKLKISMEFKNLIRPLQKKEFLQLEANLLSDGCRDPIVTWKGFIVDGHNRYEICTEHQIPFEVLEMDFDWHRSTQLLPLCEARYGLLRDLPCRR